LAAIPPDTGAAAFVYFALLIEEPGRIIVLKRKKFILIQKYKML
jgi:hypothetical protein